MGKSEELDCLIKISEELDALKKIASKSKHKTRVEFANDIVLLDACVLRLIRVGNYCRNLSAETLYELKDVHLRDVKIAANRIGLDYSDFGNSKVTALLFKFISVGAQTKLASHIKHLEKQK